MVTELEQNYRDILLKPTITGILTAVTLYVSFLILDFYLIETNFGFVVLIKAITTTLVVIPLIILQRLNFLRKFLYEFVTYTYILLVISLVILVDQNYHVQLVQVYYPLIIPLFMVWMAAFYFGSFPWLIVLFGTGILSIVGVHLIKEEWSSLEIVTHFTFMASVALASLIYNYFLKKVRFRFMRNNILIKEQKEALKQNLYQVKTKNDELVKRKELLEAQLKQLKSQLPKSVHIELSEILKEIDLQNTTEPLNNKVFSERQIDLLLEHELTNDEVLLLSGIYLRLGYSEIQANLFPHLSTRSLENMASKIRGKLDLKRGADLGAFVNDI